MMNQLKKIFSRFTGMKVDDRTEVAAAIAVALTLHEMEGVHDKESYIITIRKR